MSKKDLNNKVKKLRKLKIQRDELEAMIESLTDEIKAKMTAQETDTLVGTDWKITWREYTSHRIDTTAFKTAMPDVAEQFMRISTFKRFCLN